MKSFCDYMKISISGTPCTGKTEVSKLLSKKLKYKLIQVNELAEKLNAFTGYDKKRECNILDIKKLEREINKIKDNFVIEGHTSHLFSVDIVIVLRCNPEVLKKRLEKRYPKNNLKVKENLETEILGVITSEAIMTNKNVCEIDTTDKKPEEVVDNILEILRGNINKFKLGKIDWLERYIDMIEIRT